MLLLAGLAGLAGGCSRPAAGASAQSRATVTGTAVFVDAPTDADGAHREPEAPTAQRGSLWLTLGGPADIADPCPDASDGLYRAYYVGEAALADGRVTAPIYPSTSPPTYTPGGCAASRLEVHGVWEAQVLLEIPVSPAACRGLCAGYAREQGYERCLNSGDPRGCREAVEPGVAEVCATTCADGAAIAGDGRVNMATLPAVDASELRDGELGDVRTMIVLDRVLDTDQQALALP